MKLHILNKVLGLGIIALGITACTDGNDWSTDASKSRMFSVSSNDISIVRYMTELDITFTPVKGAEAYTLEISRDTLYDEIEEGATATSQVIYLTPAEAKDTIRVKDLKKDTRYYVRVRTIASDKAPSKWSYYKDSRNRYYIKTKAEQLFSTAKYFAQTVIRPTDLFQDHLQLRWKKDEGSETAAVDHIVVSNGSQEIASIPLSDTDKTNRLCVINYADYGLAYNTTYNFRIYNGDDKRGELNVTTPKALPAGTHILDTDAGETLETLITSATADIVIGIPATAADAETPSDDALSISAITIPDGVSVTLIGLPGGVPRILSFTKPININGTHNLIRFENVQINDGGCQYLINQGSGFTIGSIEFDNVRIPAMSRSLFRLNTSEQCTLNKLLLENIYVESQGGGGYALLYANKSNYTIKEVYLNNSTLSNMVHSFIDFRNANVESINVNNVTFYNIIGSDKYFIDAQNSLPIYNINNSIFAKTNNKNAKGIRDLNTEKKDDEGKSLYFTYTFGTCYMTSDFVFKTDAAAEKPEWAGRPFYAGNNVPASTKIMKDPKNGDFTITDNTVEGGDPRWIQPNDD